MAIGTERNAINHQGKESFDGELARLLMYETALDRQEMQEVLSLVADLGHGLGDREDRTVFGFETLNPPAQVVTGGVF